MPSSQALVVNYAAQWNSWGLWYQFEQLYIWMIMSFRLKEDLSTEKDWPLLNLRISATQVHQRQLFTQKRICNEWETFVLKLRQFGRRKPSWK